MSGDRGATTPSELERTRECDHRYERTVYDEARMAWKHGCTRCGRVREVPNELTGLSRATRQKVEVPDV